MQSGLGLTLRVKCSHRQALPPRQGWGEALGRRYRVVPVDCSKPICGACSRRVLRGTILKDASAERGTVVVTPTEKKHPLLNV